MADKQIKQLIKKRAVIKGKLTSFSTYLNSISTEELSDLKLQIELNLRLDRIKNVYDEFDGFQSELEESSDDPIEQSKERESFESLYYSLVSAGQALLETYRKQTLPSIFGDAEDTAVGFERTHKRKVVELPKIDLPFFSGDYQHWLGYRDTFTSLIHSDVQIDPINKYHYLRASLKGNAALTIAGLDFCASNYDIAWKILCERYDNKRLLEIHHLKSLFEMEVIQKESSKALHHLIDTTNKNLRALASLGHQVNYWDSLIVYMMSSKLDSTTYREWEFHRNNLTDSPTLDIFSKFITNKADLLETLDRSLLQHQKPKQDLHSNKSKSFVVSTSTPKINYHTCPLCNKNHNLFNCDSFRMLPVDIRIKKAKEFKLCNNCLRPGHTENKCKLSHCKYCKLKHNTLLHLEPSLPSPSYENVTLSAENSNINNPNSYTVLLSTALINVIDSDGQSHTARMLLDNGSTANFITQDLCGKLNLNTFRVDARTTGINNQIVSSTHSCSLILESCISGYRTSIDCIIIPKISSSLPNTYINIQDIKIPYGISLADPSFNVPSTVDILVGADVFWSVIGTNRISLGKNKPILFETKFGWLVSGTLYNNHNNDKPICMLNQNLDFDLSRFWELDSIASKHHLSPEERACEEHFIKTTKRKSDGRFIVSLPLKESPEVLGDSFIMAKQRFLSLERRLEKDPYMKKLYVEFMKEYLELGHMSESSQSSGEKSCYLPHHGVLKDSLTTKLRVVFDASAATTSGKSLNDILKVGPTVQNDLLSILLRFRQHKYVVTADVEKMFRQTEIFEQQRALQQILWRFDPSHTLKAYQLNTVTYGTASASYLATRCLTQIGHDSKDIEVKRAICNDFYVDDFLSGQDSINKTIALCTGVTIALNSAKLNLRKWYSNNQSILKAVSTDTKVSGYVDLSSANLSKTLGLNWKCSSDTLLFSINICVSNVINKRSILSTIAQIFDPLGLVTPCIVEAKVLMQQLWVNKCTWDEPIPKPIQKTWIDFVKFLPQLNNINIPRCVIGNTPIDIQLHIFSDASEKAYGACIYVRCLDGDGTVTVRLVASKCKVAPLKATTIPRLELCAALLGARLGKKVFNSFTIRFTRCVMWLDSMIVLGWLSSSSNQLKPFVRHRVSEIQEGFSKHTWRYVPSKQNPADLASRGLAAHDLANCLLWWSGPTYLQLDESNWPTNPIIEISVSPLPETIKCFHVTAENNTFSNLINDCSSFSKLQRIISFIFRFVYNCRNANMKMVGNISLFELNNATNFLLKIAQQDSFHEEIELLKTNKKLPTKNRLLPLSPFLDDNNLIRVGGRLANTHYDYNVKHPALISAKHKLCKLIFEMIHIKHMHPGPQLLLAIARHNYWPIGGTNLAKSVARSCIICCRMKGKTIQPVMGNVPKQRAQLEFPFLETGVDYAGPVMIANHKGRGCKLIKSYICVFVCLATKALHLELVSDMTKEAFVAALNRFTARRGKPQTIFSDNGSTFVGTFHELSKLLKEIRSTDITEQGIQFSFIPAYTPHFGGLWESAVKSTKHHLRRVLGLTNLDYEEMNTLLIQVEAILNSRPITSLSDDPSDLSPLTPSHFLIGRSLMFVPHPEVTNSRISSLQRFHRIEVLKQHFWGRFSNEYITLLQQKSKWFQSQDTLKEGALVVIKDKSSPPLMWLLGRIIRVLPGGDGIARVADIKTKRGVIRRAYNTICPLPSSTH